MDIQRKGVAQKKTIRRVAFLMLALAVAAVAAWRIKQLKPAAPGVDAATLWPGTVQRGPMVRDVRGTGTLVPEDILWIQAAFDAQVKDIRAQSGDEVKPGTVLIVLSNPQMEADAVDYEWQTKQAEANYADLKVRLQSQTFDQESVVGVAKGDVRQMELAKNKEEQLFAAHLNARYDTDVAVAKWEQAQSKYETEKKKLNIMNQSAEAQLDAQKVQIEKLRATYALKKQQVDDLTIRAGIPGRMQEMTLQVGQRVKPGDILAKVAQPWKLMARLQIAETQAKDIVIGQKAQVDTRNGTVAGHVTRIDASIVNGTRTVDCKLDGPLPAGAVPDLTVDGNIELERLTNVLFVNRPASSQPNSASTLFRYEADGKEATRVPVKFGRASVSAIEITDGLKEGDKVILSDMSTQDQYQRIRLQ